MIGKFRNFYFLSFCFTMMFSSLRAQSVKCTTNLPANINTGETSTVEINISKGNLSSFAKFQMDLPAGFSASPVEIKGGSWTFDQQRAKIVWVAIPSEPNFVIKFKMTASKNSSESATINAKLFYLENNVKQEYELPPHTISIKGGVNNETASNINNNTETKKEEKVIENKESTEENSESKVEEKKIQVDQNKEQENKQVVANENKKENNSTTTTENKSNSTSSKSNVKTVYRLQIGAFSTKPPASKFKEFKDVWIYEENGMFKVTIGKFSTLNDAEAFKAEMKNKGTEGFVVTFDNNIHVKIHD